jgi:DNA (cytosine-5)-methyltransferase 1
MKILNLYAGIGGNRKLWGNDHEITAVEYKQEIADIYHDFFPKDKIVVTDAHQYLLEHFEEYDFIWSSPPCPSHSRIRNVAGVGRGQNKPIYPDMELYEEIIFLQQVFNSGGTGFNGKYVVENVVSYYKPLIKAAEVGKHYFWSNFHIRNFTTATRGHMEGIKELAEIKGFPMIKDRTLLRNCVEPEVGKHILDCAINESQQNMF